GEYVLEFDLVRPYVGRFAEHGSTAPRVPCRVQSARRVPEAEFDYVTLYRQSDLNSDYWTVVGPRSKDEFDHLGRGKLEYLIGLGLTPDSSILDVGCGTGMLAGQLLSYLSPQGCYYGTDIAREAITFCRKRYRRPNFVFL